LNPVHYYVYYKFDPVRIEEVRTVVDELFAEIRSNTGIQGEWQRRRDDPSTFMEIFANVPDADVFGRTLHAALDKVGFTRLGFPRITEIFQCA
jgi:quinol monooxygenase YgiN